MLGKRHDKRSAPSAPLVKVVLVALVSLAVLAALAALLPGRQLYLELAEKDTGRVLFRRAVVDGERFTVRFRHSVERTPVLETYAVHGTGFRLVETVFYSFGAGLPTDASGAERLIVENGRLRIVGFKREFKQVLLAVGTVADHWLLFGKNADEVGGVRLRRVARPGTGVWIRVVRASLWRDIGEEARAWLRART